MLLRAPLALAVPGAVALAQGEAEVQSVAEALPEGEGAAMADDVLVVVALALLELVASEVGEGWVEGLN